jgi:hypothetical protein
MTWLQQNWPVVVSISGALYTLLSIINGLIQNPEAKSILGKVLDGLSFLSRASAPGTVKAPLTMSKKPEAAAAPDGASLRVLLPLALAALSLSACAGAKAWAKCELGQLPQVAQTVIPDVVIDLQGANTTQVVSQLEQLGGALAPGQIACIVQAVLADVSASKAALSTVQRQMVANGNAFLAKHPACCGAKK